MILRFDPSPALTHWKPWVEMVSAQDWSSLEHDIITSLGGRICDLNSPVVVQLYQLFPVSNSFDPYVKLASSCLPLNTWGPAGQQPLHRGMSARFTWHTLLHPLRFQDLLTSAPPFTSQAWAGNLIPTWTISGLTLEMPSCLSSPPLPVRSMPTVNSLF